MSISILFQIKKIITDILDGKFENIISCQLTFHFKLKRYVITNIISRKFENLIPCQFLFYLKLEI